MCSSGFCALRFANQSCDDSDTGGIIGTWGPDRNGVFNLKGCPKGHSLENQTAGIFVYVAQRCVRCLATEYIVFPNTQECQLCPRGLECRGDDVVESKVPGSVWEQIDGVFTLKSCPTGYLLENSTMPRQQCAGCASGFECTTTTGACMECTPCSPGYYKETLGPEFCEPCAQNTYQPDYAATSISACLACPRLATTLEIASTRAGDCFCSESTYIMGESLAGSTGADSSATTDFVFWCNECPVGAECASSATGFCALRNDNISCPDPADTIVGDWSRVSPGGMFELTACPSGYALVNALEGTSTGPFWHGSQRCDRCEPGQSYIINPNEDQCQRCPEGLCSNFPSLSKFCLRRAVLPVARLRGCSWMTQQRRSVRWL